MVKRRLCRSGRGEGEETKRGKEKDRKGRTGGRMGWEEKKTRARKYETKIRREGGWEGGAGLTSTWFNILLYSVLRASRVTRTRPS